MINKGSRWPGVLLRKNVRAGDRGGTQGRKVCNATWVQDSCAGLYVREETVNRAWLCFWYIVWHVVPAQRFLMAIHFEVDG